MKLINILKISLLFVIFFQLTSCEKGTEGSTAFSGQWGGTYTGAKDSGTWLIQVDQSGKVNGAAHSIEFDADYSVSGYVGSNGEVNFTAGTATSGATFTGNVSGTTAAGNWVNTVSYSGTWSGGKY